MDSRPLAALRNGGVAAITNRDMLEGVVGVPVLREIAHGQWTLELGDSALG